MMQTTDLWEGDNLGCRGRLPALRLAEIDRQQGNLGPDSGKTVADVALTVIRELGETKCDPMEDALTKDIGCTPPDAWLGNQSGPVHSWSR